MRPSRVCCPRVWTLYCAFAVAHALVIACALGPCHSAGARPKAAPVKPAADKKRPRVKLGNAYRAEYRKPAADKPEVRTSEVRPHGRR